ncbi:MAG: hypothetical protein WBY94_03525, partial [Polyangiaceae bacterium]
MRRNVADSCGFAALWALALATAFEVGCGESDFSIATDASAPAALEAGASGVDRDLPPIYINPPPGAAGDDSGMKADAPVGASDTGSPDGADATPDAEVVIDSSMREAAPGPDSAVVPSALGETADAETDAGNGTTCVPGGACSPSDCENGTWACLGGSRVCQATTAFDAGTPCGGDGGSSVCNAGQCIACNAGGDCSDAVALCVKKAYDCSSGAPVCKVTGNVSDGTACGAGLYCNAGVCAACEVGAACLPATNACHVGTVAACTGGTPTCTDQGTAAPAGTVCSAAGVASGVCDGNGACVACRPGAQCNPGGNACQVGIEACSTGYQCVGTTNVREGQTCGAGQICHNGACSACDNTSCFGGCCDSHGCVTTTQT